MYAIGQFQTLRPDSAELLADELWRQAAKEWAEASLSGAARQTSDAGTTPGP